MFLSNLGMRSVLLLLAVLLYLVWGNGAFQSDELEDEEWGLISPPKRPPPVSVEVPSSVDSNKLEFSLEHAFGNSEFAPAGVFTARLRPSSRGGQALVKLRLTRIPFSEEDKMAFEELLKEDGFYTVRVPASPLTHGQTFVVSSTKARCLAAADFNERIDVHSTNMDQGNIIALSYYAGAECAYPRVLKKPSKWSFDTHIVSKSAEQASRPLILNDLELGSGETPGDEAVTTKKPVEKSFWAKYWMYIVPLGIIVMNAVTQMANMQDEQGQSAGQQPGPAARAAVRRR